MESKIPRLYCKPIPFFSSRFLFSLILVFFSLICIWNIMNLKSTFCHPVEKTLSPTRAQSLSQNGPLTKTEQNDLELIILVWTWPFGERFPLDTCEKVYGISGCHLTVDKSLYNRADAVIIHHQDIMYLKSKLPQAPRPPHQRWVWFNLESPSYTPNMDFVENLINLTMTYRHDSDIIRPYGWLEVLKEPQEFIIPKKSKLVAWAVSNWNPNTRRVQYYEELKKHIHIDIFGKQHIPLKWDDFISIISEYKFYLSFENSNHVDYITEKLWNNALIAGAVPVVSGPPRENYERFLPRDSFIHINDFPSAREMAAYLLELDANDEKYRRYFQWRSQFRVRREVNWDNHYCKACRALRQAPAYKIIPSVAKWFSTQSYPPQ
ncbi:alpha-(1,3)-fucosyltransferase 9-like [Rhinatrema bivittatum]|uniref:alpha-(1,3)-fucosyltransferase 9-like n=1 Tax=Rhinatrema bivittatum TaxID=194408 RepID=UPI001127E49D|nr:alpha-(1,3)-fucosyltransferase 9-like [Rhinatrema bivittatum]